MEKYCKKPTNLDLIAVKIDLLIGVIKHLAIERIPRITWNIVSQHENDLTRRNKNQNSSIDQRLTCQEFPGASQCDKRIKHLQYACS